jgi:GNAT superfamily N-acetyltransferase
LLPESPTAAHVASFEAIAADPNQLLVRAVDKSLVVGAMQLTFIPGLARNGAWRLQIEAMRVRRDHRSQGIGRQMMRWALERARERHCTLVQLTSDSARTDAHRFYLALGFKPSHVGFKLWLRADGRLDD